VSVWADLMHNKLIGPFFFSKKAVTRRSYLDMLELFVLPPLSSQTILQQDEAPPHLCHNIRNRLDREILGNGLAEVDHSHVLLCHQI
jgi:hypothetical protein